MPLAGRRWCTVFSFSVPWLEEERLPFSSCHYCFLLTDFFSKHAVAVMTVRELFDFVTDPSITADNMDAYLEKVRRAEERTHENLPLCGLSEGFSH